MNWAEECSFEEKTTGDEGSFQWTSSRKSTGDDSSNSDGSQRFLYEKGTDSLWDNAVTNGLAQRDVGPASAPPPPNLWTLRERPVHLTDSDLALSQEIFIRRCQAQDKVDFKDLLTPEMQLEAQQLLNAKFMQRSMADSWIDENSWNQFHSYAPEYFERFDDPNILLYRISRVVEGYETLATQERICFDELPNKITNVRSTEL